MDEKTFLYSRYCFEIPETRSRKNRFPFNSCFVAAFSGNYTFEVAFPECHGINGIDLASIAAAVRLRNGRGVFSSASARIGTVKSRCAIPGDTELAPLRGHCRRGKAEDRKTSSVSGVTWPRRKFLRRWQSFRRLSNGLRWNTILSNSTILSSRLKSLHSLVRSNKFT